MSKASLEILEVDTDVTKTYKVNDKFTFKLTLDCHGPIEDDVEFEVVYFGDAVTDHNDQRIGYNIIGPLQSGKQFFELETTPIDLTKVPIKTLFGLTTILIIGKYHKQQFIRVGYVVNVKYPGVDGEKLMDSDDVPLNEEECDEEEEAIEVMDDEELEGDSEGQEGSEEDSEEGSDESGLVEGSEEDDEDDGECHDEECQDEACHEHCCHDAQSLMESIFNPTGNREPIPCETTIVAGVDEFEYKGMQLKQSVIELELLQKPIMHVYEIDWAGDAEQEETIQESSDSAVDNDEQAKKIKME